VAVRSRDVALTENSLTKPPGRPICRNAGTWTPTSGRGARRAAGDCEFPLKRL